MKKILTALTPFLFRRLKKKRYWVLIAALASSGWAYVQDFTPDQLWKEPRDLLVDRIEVARDAQEKAAGEFKTALEQFKEVTRFEGGALEEKYLTLQDTLDRSEKAAARVNRRIGRVTGAANRLLDEWKEELGQYADRDMKRNAESQFDATRSRCEALIERMRGAEKKMDPVLAAFRDQVLYLKHNLNAQAIAALQEDAAQIEQNVSALIAEMEASIAEANAFIQSLESAGLAS